MDDTELRRYAAEALRQMDRQAGHPSVDDIAEFVRGESVGIRRDQLESHLMACAPCRLRVEEFKQFVADCEIQDGRNVDAEWKHLQSRIRWHNLGVAARRWGGIAAAIVVVAGVSWSVFRMLTPSTAGLLAQAYQEQRSFDFRMAGAKHADVRVERAGESLFSRPAPLLKAGEQLKSRVLSNPDDPEALRLMGEAQMMMGEAAEAVRTLEKARDLNRRDAHILADLGTAYALRGDVEKQPGDYFIALDHLGEALQMEPAAHETLFNLALVLERVQLKDQAVDRWEEYLRLDPSSDWAKEAERHLAELKAEMKSREDSIQQVADDPVQLVAALASGNAVDAEAYLRDIAVTKWLPHFQFDAATRDAITKLAGVLKERHGDSWLADTIGPVNRPELAASLNELGMARAANRDANTDAALALAKHAQQTFLLAGGRTGNLWARFEEVVSLHNSLNRDDECLEAAAALERDLESHGYPWMKAQVEIEYAICAMRRGRLAEAGARLKHAIQISDAARFDATSLRAQNMYLACARHAGLPSEVFASAERSLNVFWRGAYPYRNFYQVVDELRDIAAGSQQKYATWILARSGVWSAQKTGDPRSEAPARANLAVAAQAVGREAEARSNLETADELFTRISSGYRWEPEIDLAGVELDRGDAEGALKRLKLLSDSLGSAPTVLVDTRYYSALGRAYARKGMAAEAVEAFQNSIEHGKRRIAALASESERSGVLAAIEASYRGLVATRIATSEDSTGALREWQSFRALDAVGDSVEPRASSHTVLWFVELSDGFVSWLSTRDRPLFHRIEAPKGDVSAVANRFLRECSDPASPAGRLNEDALQLYRWMVEPFADELMRQESEVVFELDGALAGVPVQALMSQEGWYLGDRFSVLVSSGYASPKQTGPTAANVKVLVVADPALGGESARRFPPLPESLKEADALRAKFSAASILSGSSATLEAFVSSLPNAEIVHFAGHGYSNSANGALLFASSNRDRDDYALLRSAELRRQNWSNCRLAVLSACATAAGESRGVHNPDSLVRALTRAGVPRVAATLWNVDSTATAELIKEFYSSLARGEGPAQALRAAQQQVRRQRPAWDHPYYWAGFQMYGTT